jgi:photosystem II stability/assembly factor-like uncharacterized protein
MSARGRRRRWPSGLVVAAVAAGIGVAARTDGPSPPLEKVLSGLTFRAIGPATTSGRIDDVAVLETNPAVFYVAAATGGLWKTTNNGTTWEVLFNDRDDVVSIGDVAIPPDDPDLVWVGTGENNNRQSSSWGTGVYKSTDGGHTWKAMGLADARHVGRIVIDPVDHDTVYVAATGHLFGPNQQRGVMKTSDGGSTWSTALFIDGDTGATDLVMDPSNNKVLYAATYQRRRSAWGFNGGGPGSGLYKSEDAGRTWSKLTNGIPTGDLGRIGIDIYRRDPRIVYASIEHEKEGGVYRSDNGGASWTKMSGVNPRPMYFSQIRVDPNDDRRVYLGGVSLHISDDGGRTFAIDKSAVQVGIWYPHSNPLNSSLHTDEHALWVDPANSNHLIIGNDGGVSLSWDRGKTWDLLDNMDLGQFYHVGYDMDAPYHVYGGLQDNLAMGGPSAVRSYLGIGNLDWFFIAGGDGFVSVADPKDSRIIYSEAQNGNMARVDRLTNERTSIRPEAAKGERPLRWNWNAPMIISPHDAATLFMAANRVFKSADRGESWTAISPDLTAGIDRETLSLMGVAARDFKIAKNDGVTNYGTLVAFAESPKKAGLYYAGADDGTVQVSNDEGKTWTNVTGRFPGLPARTYVSRLAPSAFDEGTVYASFDGHWSDDYTPFIYASTDAGNRWTSIAHNLPQGQVVKCVAEDLKNRNVLYAGTEFGLYVSLDRGGSWTRLRNNLPTVPVDEITLHPRDNDMILATHGRSIWILDDLAPIQQASDALKTDAYLFDIRPTTSFNPAHDRWWMGGDRKFWGRNPAYGASISYYLREPAKETTLTVEDAKGAMVRVLSAAELEGSSHAGINRVHWNLRHQPLTPPRGPSAPPPAQISAGSRQVRAHMFQEIERDPANPYAGPAVLPGEYRVALSVNGREVAARSVNVLPDPLIAISDADRHAWHDAALEVHELQRHSYEAAAAVGAASDQLETAAETVRRSGNLPAPVRAAVDDLAGRLTALRRQLGSSTPGDIVGRTLPSRLASLKAQLYEATGRPTRTQARTLAELRGELAAAIDAVNNVITRGLPDLQKALASQGSTLTPLSPVRPLVTRGE